MEYTADDIDNDITLLPKLLKMFSMFQIRCWYNKVHNDKNKLENIDLRCDNCVKETVLSMKNMDKNYKDIITLFVLNTVLHHAGMSWIIKKQTFGIWYEKNPYWMTGGPGYNISICKKFYGKLFG